MLYLLSVLALSGLVLVHELGHWLVAQVLGLPTPIFSIGFGRLYLRLGNWRNTEFRLCPLLFGGCVLIKGLVPTPEEGGISEEISSNTEGTPSHQYSIGESLLGTAFGAITYWLLPNLPEDNAKSTTDPYPLAPRWQRALVALAGPLASLLAPVFILTVAYSTFGGSLKEDGSCVAWTMPSTPAQTAASVHTGDHIWAINGQTVKQWLTHEGLQVKKGVPINLTLERQGKTMQVVIYPAEAERGHLGIYLSPSVTVVRRSLREAFSRSLKEMAQGLSNGRSFMVRSFIEIWPHRTNETIGPVGIIRIGAHIYRFYGPLYFAQFWAVISLTLAIVNLMPIPGLDGGHLLFSGLEVVRHKPLNAWRQFALTFFSCLLLLIALVWVTIYDLL